MSIVTAHAEPPLRSTSAPPVPMPSPCHKRVLVVQAICDVRLCDPAALSFPISWSLLKLMSIESVMPSKHLILWHPFLLLPSIFPSTRVFSNESFLHIRWPEYWSFSFSISPSNEYSGLVSSSETLPKSCRRRRISNSLCEASITLIPKQTEVSHTHTRLQASIADEHIIKPLD